MFMSIAGVTLPTFVVGIVLIGVFSVKLAWLPSFGRGDVVNLGHWTTGFLTASGSASPGAPVHHPRALPGHVLATAFCARSSWRSGRSEHIRFARARGLSERRIWFVYALKNTLLPVITVLGLQLGNVIAFSVVTENVFAWPGLGSLFLQSIQTADMPVISIYLILIGAIFMLINLAVELTYPLIDARVLVRHG